MKILTPIARIIDPTLAVSIAEDERTLCASVSQRVMNPFDEVALTKAVSLKRDGAGDEVVAVGVGPEGYSEILRSALAMQADRAIWIPLDEAATTPATVSAILAALVRRETPDLVLCGKQSADDDACCVPQMLAGRLDYPQAISAVALSVEGDRLTARCDHGHHLADVTLPLPAVVGADLMLCPPRFPTLARILKAKKQPIERLAWTDLIEALESDACVEKREFAPGRARCVYLSSIDEAADLIRRQVG